MGFASVRKFGFLVAALWASGAGAATTSSCKVVLVPGAFAVGAASNWFLNPRDYFADYRSFFESKGCFVHLAQFPPDATIEVRGLVLRDQVERIERERGPGVFVVTHSQGGLDIRYALHSLKLQGVVAVASVGSPHEGTPLADWVVRERERGRFWYWALRLAGGYDLRELRFAPEFTAGFLKAHATYFDPVPGVRYASARAVCQSSGCHPALRLVDWLAGVGSGDGLIPASSQSFGEDLGTFELDHITEVSTEKYSLPERIRLLQRIWEFFDKAQ